jgi:hypothetical protein
MKTLDGVATIVRLKAGTGHSPHCEGESLQLRDGSAYTSEGGWVRRRGRGGHDAGWTRAMASKSFALSCRKC